MTTVSLLDAGVDEDVAQFQRRQSAFQGRVREALKRQGRTCDEGRGAAGPSEGTRVALVFVVSVLGVAAIAQRENVLSPPLDVDPFSVGAERELVVVGRSSAGPHEDGATVATGAIVCVVAGVEIFVSVSGGTDDGDSGVGTILDYRPDG